MSSQRDLRLGCLSTLYYLAQPFRSGHWTFCALGGSPAPPCSQVPTWSMVAPWAALKAVGLVRPLRSCFSSCTGMAVGSSLLSPQEVMLTDQLLLEGQPSGSPETPELPATTQSMPHADRKEQDVSSRPADEQAEQEATASLMAWDASATEQLRSAAEHPPSSPGFVCPRTTDCGASPGLGKAGSPESRLPTGAASSGMSPLREASGGDSPAPSPRALRGDVAKDSGMWGRSPEGEQPPKAAEATVCANNSKVSSTGEKVVLWTR